MPVSGPGASSASVTTTASYAAYNGGICNDDDRFEHAVEHVEDVLDDGSAGELEKCLIRPHAPAPPA